jgi:hypothetical protein
MGKVGSRGYSVLFNGIVLVDEDRIAGDFQNNWPQNKLKAYFDEEFTRITGIGVV